MVGLVAHTVVVSDAEPARARAAIAAVLRGMSTVRGEDLRLEVEGYRECVPLWGTGCETH